MPEYAKAPNSCELNSTMTRGWQIQCKPKGTAAEQWAFVLGLTAWNSNVEKTTVDATDLNSDGWDTQTGVGRSLKATGTTKYPTKGGLPILQETTQMIKLAGEEIGENEQLDFRWWREDVDEGWEGTFVVKFTENSGDSKSFRTANIELLSNCAPTRIHSVLKGAEKKESVPLTPEELANLLAGKPSGTTQPPVDTDGDGNPDSTDPAPTDPLVK